MKRRMGMGKRRFSAVVTKGEVAYVSYCPELGVASQGKTRTGALANLKEAVGLYLEEAEGSKVIRKSGPSVSTFYA